MGIEKFENSILLEYKKKRNGDIEVIRIFKENPKVVWLEDWEAGNPNYTRTTQKIFKTKQQALNFVNKILREWNNGNE